MHRTKKLLIGLVTVAAMPAFADTKTTTSSSSERRLEALFKADLQYRSESQSDAVVVAEGREGVYIGSGDGTVAGDRLRGTVRWSLWSGNCLYPLVRGGQSVPDGLHLCTINPAGFIDTLDGARIRFDGRGYGLRSSDKYQTNLTLVFSTEDVRYAWLTKLVAVMEGDFDEKTGRATWNVYVTCWKPLMRFTVSLAYDDNSRLEKMIHRLRAVSFVSPLWTEELT
jgi:hypothetical protein